MAKNLLQQAIRDAGYKEIAAACAISYQAVHKWGITGLPRTEFTGETSYASKICQVLHLKGKSLTPGELLEESAEMRKQLKTIQGANP